MSVIAQLSLSASSFELGRILEVEPGTTIQLETLVPIGETPVPFLTVTDSSRDDFEEQVRNHPSVERFTVASTHDEKALYALDWAVDRDLFFQGILEAGAHLLSGVGTADTWEFEVRFPDHAAMSAFQEYCSNAHIDLEVGRVYNPTRPDSGPWYGLSQPQRETLSRAVEGGYYAIPREMSTKELAETFGISDQAVTERLRRAIVTLVENTLLAAMDAQAEGQM